MFAILVRITVNTTRSIIVKYSVYIAVTVCIKKSKQNGRISKACDNYLQSESAEKSFVTKEYLSKALLEYMLGLELLPEIYHIAEE